MAKKILYPISFVIIFVAVMFLGILAYENVDKNNQTVVNNFNEKVERQELMVSLYGEAGKDYTYVETTKKITSDSNQILRIYETAKTEASYNVYNGEEYVGRMYKIRTTSNPTGNGDQVMEIMFAYNGDPSKESVELAGYKVLTVDAADYYGSYVSKGGKTYQEMLSSRMNSTWNVQDITSKTYLESYSAISGATYTTTAIINALMCARKQIYDDCGLKVPEPSLKVTLNSIVQDSSVKTVSNKFNGNITLKSDNYDNVEMNVVYTYDGTNVGIESVTNVATSQVVSLDTNEQSAVIKAFAAPTVYISNIADMTLYTVYTVKSTNSFGVTLTAVITVSESGLIDSVDMTNSSYDSRGNSYDYQTVQNSAEGELIDSVSLTNISGQTVTTDAFKAMFTYLKKWIGGME